MLPLSAASWRGWCRYNTTQINTKTQVCRRTFFVAPVESRRTTRTASGAPGRKPRGAYSCTRIYDFGSDFRLILLLFPMVLRSWWRPCVHNTTQIIVEAKFAHRTFLVALVDVRRTTRTASGVPGRRPRGAYSGTRTFYSGAGFFWIFMIWGGGGDAQISKYQAKCAKFSEF